MTKSSILIVDDEPINLKRAAECLNPYYELHLARSGEEALSFLTAHGTDLILLDIKMPVMNGFEVAEQVMSLPERKNIPIIYLTGDHSEHTITTAFNSGAVDYIPKPFRDEELLARVKNRIETDKLKRELHSALDTNEQLLDIINHYVSYIKTNLSGVITQVSSNLCEAFQTSKTALIGQNISILKSGYTPQEFYQSLWQTIQSGHTFINEIENRNFKGGTNWYRVTITSDINKEGKFIGYVAFYQNIDDKVQYKRNAQLDFLTGLYNRSKFEETIKKEILRCERYGHSLSLIMADIDHFKSVNDIYGHDVGDSVLKEFSCLLTNHIRKTDVLARWGGEEFIILCPHTNLNGAKKLAEALRTLTDTFEFSMIGHKTASFGVAEYHAQSDSKKLFVEVDQALYNAKLQGRNQVAIFSNQTENMPIY